MSARRIGLGSLFVATAFLWAGGCGGGGGGGGVPPGGGGLPSGGNGSLAGVLTLTTSNRSAAAEAEPNDSLGQPHDLGQFLVGQRVTIFGSIDRAADPFDGFRMRCPQRAVVTATLTFDDAVPNDLDLLVYDPTSLQIVESFPMPATGAQGPFVARATFDVVVAAIAGATEYRLDVAFAVAPTGLTEREPNDLPAEGQYTGVVFPGETLALVGVADPSVDVTDVWLVPFPLAASVRFEFRYPAFQRFDLEVLDGTSDVVNPTPLATYPGTTPAPLIANLSVPAGTLLVLRARAVSGGGGLWQLAVEATAPPPGTPKPGLSAGRPPAPLEREGGRVPGLVARYGRAPLPLVDGEVLVRCADESRGDASVGGAGGVEVARVPGGVRRVRVPMAAGLAPEDAARATLGAALALDGAPGVLYAEPNQWRRAYEVPDDLLYPRQWHYEQIHLAQAWELSKGASDVIVAVIDTGIKPHPDLLPRLLSGYDFVSNSTNAQDFDGMDPDPTDRGGWPYHGTHVAGTVGAVTDNGTGVAGVTWGTMVMPLRALGIWGGSDFDIAQAILYAARLPNASGELPAQRAHVINMSLGGDGFSSTMAAACTAAHDAGLVIVAASGNENSPSVGFPAGNAHVIAVGATDARGERTHYSNWGTNLDVMAPGGDMGQDASGDGFPDGVLSTLWDASGNRGTYEYMMGTSMASPHVAGVAALILSVSPALTPLEVESAITQNTRDMEIGGYDAFTGWGLVDAFRAVASAISIALNPAELHLDCVRVDFGAVEVERNLAITNFGTVEPLTIETVDVDTANGGAWLTAFLGPAGGNSNASYLRLVVSRAGLDPGGYSADVSLTSNGGPWNVHVTMSVLPDLPPLPVIPLRLFVTDVQTGQLTRFVDIDANASYAWDIPSLPIGQYLLTAGTDLDHDGSYEDEGEYVGAWPSLDQPQMIQVGVNQTITGLRLTVSPRTSIEGEGTPGR
jgi:subtilisin family serine protease